MTLPRNGYIRTLIAAVAVLLVLLISINIFLNAKLDRYAVSYLTKFSEKSGFTIGVDDIGVDPLFRVTLDGVTVSDSAEGEAPLAEIKRIRLEPGFFASLLERRIKIGEIVIEHPVMRYDKAAIDKLSGLIEGGGGGGGKPPSVAVERVRLEDARINISSDLTVVTENTEILITEGRSGNPGVIDLAGDVSAYDFEAEFKGEVNLFPGRTDGTLKLIVDKLDRDLIPESFEAPRGITGVSELSFQVSDNININGRLTLNSDSGKIEGPLAEVEYGLRYDRADNTAYLDAFSFRLMDALKGSLSGSVKDVTGDMIFDLSGSTSAGSLKEIVKWFPDIRENELSGSIRSENLVIDGSRKNKNITLKSKLILDGVDFADKSEEYEIADMSCGIDVVQGLSGGFSTKTGGKCSLGSFFWKEIGEIDGVSGNIELMPREKSEQRGILLSGLRGRYMDGIVSGSLRFGFVDGGLKIGGKINGEDLDLRKTPANIIPVEMEGRATAVSADFNGAEGKYHADISFAVRDLVFRPDGGREFKISGAGSGEPVRLEYLSPYNNEQGKEGTQAGSGSKIIINGNSLSYENLSFGEYHIKGGKIEKLTLDMNPGGDWDYSMSSQGRGFELLGKEISLDSFKEHIDIENSGRRGFTGTIEGKSGKFKGVEFPSLTADYEYGGDAVIIRKLAAEVGDIGKFTTDNLSVEFGKGAGGYPYSTSFRDGEFTGFDGVLKAGEIDGSFKLNDPDSAGPEWEGKVGIGRADVSSQPLTGLSFDMTPSQEGIRLSDIKGRLMGGDLTGKTDIITSSPATRVVTDLSLHNAAVNSGETGVKIGRVDFGFSGTLPDGSLPEGAGKLEFSGIGISRNEIESVLSGSLDIRTSGETLFIDDGFIRDKDNGTLKFSGEMENTLSQKRKLEVDFPEFSIPGAMRFFRPFLPAALKDATTAGSVGLHVEVKNMFSEDSSWNGDVSFNNASFKSYMGGADLHVRDINGEVRIKDQGKFENTLASLMGGDLELDKQIYRKYERSFKEASLDGDLDLLTIGEVEYGILLFNNIECELEVDREKINLSRLVSEFFSGKLYSTGILRFDGGDVSYNFSLLFNDVSLEGISKRLSSIKDYITGRVNGLIWLTGEGGDLSTIDGPFEFWAVKSSKEARTIGKALLDQLGAKERFILGSTRSYDKGEISGYINDGVITFKTLEISNTILGYKNLSIQADPIRNSISISHLVSVIREISRRSQSGGPTIETN